MSNEIEVSLYVLVLAVPLGLELVRRVSPLLHTPLMSLTNAISAISVVGAILVSGSGNSPMLSKILGIVAVAFATINIVAGFLITDRMLKMFKKKETGGECKHHFFRPAATMSPLCFCFLFSWWVCPGTP